MSNYNYSFNFTNSIYWDKSVTKDEYNSLVNRLFNKNNGNYTAIVNEINNMPDSHLRRMLSVFPPIFPEEPLNSE